MNDLESLKALEERALRAAESSYTPYSKFPVGAAILTADRVVVDGCNVENGSYGLSICAERCALFSARAQGHMGQPLALAVACAQGDASKPETQMPCGACRQVMAEMLGGQATICVVGVGRFTLDQLLPSAFRLH